jgi:glycine C-acetyltransferase
LETNGDKLVKTLWQNADYLRKELIGAGFDTGNSQTPIIPVMIGDEKLTKELSLKLYEIGIYAVPICFPMVAMGKARIRVMNSAAHNKKHLDQALSAFIKSGKELKII